MRLIADFHIHSKYARATSPKCDIPGLAEGAKQKGISLLATGDFTHPVYFNELKRDLKVEEAGLFNFSGVRFILGTEVSVTYDFRGKNRRMHHLILAPSLDVVSQINDILGKYGNLREDGRPVLMMSSAHLAEEVFSISKECMLIPAHAWTPWFSVFGSKAGVDSVEEAFEDQARNIFALETGLSSDPAMNWTISALDKYTLISNSDAHSPGKLGREANVFELEKVTYKTVTDTIKTRKGFVKTYEFYPEEGKYHYDGHRKCKVLLSPSESKSRNDLCPVCRRKLTVGVMHRVADLADRKAGFRPDGAVPFQYIVPLPTVISKAMKKPETSVKVAEEYSKIIRYFGNEFSVFEASEEQLRLATTKEIADALVKVNTGKVKWVPGYDGVFGELILDESAPKKGSVDKKQKSLGDF
ncbi:MAG TPA: endonuclease Q family protein [Candidatus Bilamarchaeum sp.]|nr:endonuclease Q family protein [Candidatus Bilamarchaeum sp.]